MTNCPQCNSPAQFVQEHNSWYCPNCQRYLQDMQPADQGHGPPPQQGGQMTLAQQQFSDTRFVLKQKLISVAHKYFVRNSADQLVGFVQQKMFKLKEDIRIYSDESKSTEIMRIQQANILDFTGSFQVMDSQSGEIVGILKRKGLKSLLKDEWKILDANKNEIGRIKEQGGLVWLLRRFKFTFIPYKYFVEIGGQRCATVTEKFQVIGDTYFVDIEPNGLIDPRLAVAIGLMMDIGEGE